VIALRVLSKISIFLTILTVDLAFFIVIKQYFPESYDWIIATTSYQTGISLEITRSLFIIAGFVIVLICVPVILYFIYRLVEKVAKPL